MKHLSLLLALALIGCGGSNSFEIAPPRGQITNIEGTLAVGGRTGRAFATMSGSTVVINGASGTVEVPTSDVRSWTPLHVVWVGGEFSQ